MIELVAPREGCTVYGDFESMLVGPFCFDGHTDRLEEISRFRTIGDLIEGIKGMYHDNFVVHQEAKGILTFDPVTPLIESAPVHTTTDDFPSRIKVHEASNTFTENYGLAVDGTVAHGRSGSVYHHLAYRLDTYDGLNFTIVHMYAYGKPCKPLNFFRYEYSVTRNPNGSLRYVRRSVQHNHLEQTPSADWSSYDISYEFLMGCDAVTPVYGITTLSTNATAIIPNRCTAVLAPGSVRVATEILVQQLALGEFPLEEVDYGDLAMQASEDVNANNVNMLEFLSDLRHPTELIPKLRNLSSLKGLSGNFLLTQFGILPTIDDIKSIIAACRRISPYLDRNGFEIHTSGSTQTTSVEGTSYTLVQRLKLAIGMEDSELDAIISRFDSIGVLPTLENLWDLVPYSFIVDWLIDVGGFLERIDSRLRLTRLNIKYVTMSRKKIVRKDIVSSVTFPYTGYISWGQYHRWVSDQCPVPPLSLHATIGGFDHWLEAAALLIQRAKK